MRQQDHERLAVGVDAALAQAVRELAPGAIGLLLEYRDYGRGRALEPAIVEAAGSAELSLGRAPDPGGGQIQQPPDVVRSRVVPGRPQHVGPDQVSVGERRPHLVPRW